MICATHFSSNEFGPKIDTDLFDLELTDARLAIAIRNRLIDIFANFDP